MTKYFPCRCSYCGEYRGYVELEDAAHLSQMRHYICNECEAKES